MRGKFFTQPWPNSRVLAPANGWYEWVKDPVDPKKEAALFHHLERLDSDVLRRLS